MRVIENIALVAGLVLLPAALTIAGGFVLNWLERRYRRHDPATAQVDGDWRQNRAAWTAWAVPLAALSAGMVLAPATVAVAAVVANELAIGYLVTAGFALGALALNALAATTQPTTDGPRWSGAPGVLLSSAVGFTIALMSLLGGALAATLRVPPGDPRRVWVTLAVALLLGSLAYGAYRRRRRQDDTASPGRVEAPAAVETRTDSVSAEGRAGR